MALYGLHVRVFCQRGGKKSELQTSCGRKKKEDEQVERHLSHLVFVVLLNIAVSIIFPPRERCVSFVLTMFVWCVFLPQRLPSVAPIAQRSRGSNRAAYLKKAYALSSRRREGGGQIDG